MNAANAMLPPYRLPRRALGERWKVEINPLLQDCVAFLCEDIDGERIPGGTAFFVELEDKANAARTWYYLVTALHELQRIQGSTVFVRLNLLSGGGFEDIPTSKDDWFHHDTADVALIPSPASNKHSIQKVPVDLIINKDYKLDVKNFDGRGNPVLEAALRNAYPDGIQVQLGHEVFFPGLFIQSAGEKKNLPIIRYGNISRMPGDELHTLEYPDGRRHNIRGYLAESLSWGGHSGSPVFWHWEYNLTRLIDVQVHEKPPVPSESQSNIIVIPQTRRRDPVMQTLEIVQNRGWVDGLLGLVSAHYDIPRKAKGKGVVEDIVTKVNSGIAIITPAEHIRELLMREDVAEERERQDAETRLQRPTATPDFAGEPRRNQRTTPKQGKAVQIPIPSKRQFIEDLTKATRKRKPSS